MLSLIKQLGGSLHGRTFGYSQLRQSNADLEARVKALTEANQALTMANQVLTRDNQACYAIMEQRDSTIQALTEENEGKDLTIGGYQVAYQAVVKQVGEYVDKYASLTNKLIAVTAQLAEAREQQQAPVQEPAPSVPLSPLVIAEPCEPPVASEVVQLEPATPPAAAFEPLAASVESSFACAEQSPVGLSPPAAAAAAPATAPTPRAAPVPTATTTTTKKATMYSYKAVTKPHKGEEYKVVFGTGMWVPKRGGGK